jgi:hypothetical protein
MMWRQERQQVFKDVRSRDRRTQFFQERLQVFLRTLLTMKAYLVMKRIVFPTERLGGDVVGLRFSHPLLRQPFHKELSLAT